MKKKVPVKTYFFGFLDFFTDGKCFSRTLFSVFFHVHEFEFHGQNLMKNFTGTFLFSRALFDVFSGFFTGIFFFHGKKKNTGYEHPPP